MSQSSFPAAVSLHSSATFLWFSDKTLKRFIPGYRAVVDGLLICFGVFLALMHLPAAIGLFEGNNGWKLNFFLTSNLVVGLLWIVVAYLTARSSHWRDRQRVLVCLSLALLLYGGMSSLGLWIQEYPEALRHLLLCVSATAGATLTCIGLISVEKRLRSGNRGKVIPERVASNPQCLARLFFGCCFTLAAILGLIFPVFYVNSIVDGSLSAEFEKAFGVEVSGLNFCCLAMLTVVSRIHYYLAPLYSWLYLRNFHQQELHSFKKWQSLLEHHPALTAISVCFLGAIVFVILFVLLHPSPDMAPWMLLATISCAAILYRKRSNAIAHRCSFAERKATIL